MKHSAERWTVHEGCTPLGDTGDFEGYIEIREGEKIVVRVAGEADEQLDEWFKRIVACVNFCAGFKPEVLGSLEKVWSERLEDFVEATRLRAELAKNKAARAKADWVDKWAIEVLTVNCAEEKMVAAWQELRAIIQSEEKE